VSADGGKNLDASAPTLIPPAFREDLLAAARAARANAYARYSDYRVGAAVLAEDGRIFGGCNVENAMYGATVCAERVAIWTAIAAGAKRIQAIAVITSGMGSPCGFCRQVLSEFAGPDTPVFLAGPASVEDGGSAPRSFSLESLLPFAWGRSDLESGQGRDETSDGGGTPPVD
jgi:cytidine deaminase